MKMQQRNVLWGGGGALPAQLSKELFQTSHNNSNLGKVVKNNHLKTQESGEKACNN